MKSDRSKRDRFQRHKGRLVNNDTHYTATSPSQLADRKRAVEEREGGRQKIFLFKKNEYKDRLLFDKALWYFKKYC